jgi:hypothetical protein
MLAANASTALDIRYKFGPQDLPPGHHVWCSCGSVLDGTSYNNARSQLSDKFHKIKTEKLPAGDDITIVVRDVVAFACAEADQGGSLGIGAWWLTLFTRRIQKLCGDHSVGTYWIPTGGLAVMYGFKHDDGKDACSNVPALSPNTCNHPPLKDETPMPPEDKRSTSNVTRRLGLETSIPTADVASTWMEQLLRKQLIHYEINLIRTIISQVLVPPAFLGVSLLSYVYLQDSSARRSMWTLTSMIIISKKLKALVGKPLQELTLIVLGQKGISIMVICDILPEWNCECAITRLRLLHRIALNECKVKGVFEG